MKISNSKRQLAQLLIEAGVTQLPEGANWAAQDKSGMVWAYLDMPKRLCEIWVNNGLGLRKLQVTIPNWHQTVLSRDEFDQIVAEAVVPSEPDADGWIEWSGGERPVDKDCRVVCKMRSGREWRDGKAIKAEVLRWYHSGSITDIIAYRLHKPEKTKPDCCESAMRSIPEPESKTTIEQLAADYRNKLDYANRKQDEADKANMDSDAALSKLEAAIAEIGFAITPIDAVAQYPEPVITDWRDLQIGDVIELTGSVNPCWKEHSGSEMTVEAVFRDQGDNDDQVYLIGESGCWAIGGNTTWRFIRRPAK